MTRGSGADVVLRVCVRTACEEVIARAAAVKRMNSAIGLLVAGLDARGIS